jgi:hypothetical protein
MLPVFEFDRLIFLLRLNKRYNEKDDELEHDVDHRRHVESGIFLRLFGHNLKPVPLPSAFRRHLQPRRF